MQAKSLFLLVFLFSTLALISPSTASAGGGLGATVTSSSDSGTSAWPKKNPQAAVATEESAVEEEATEEGQGDEVAEGEAESTEDEAATEEASGDESDEVVDAGDLKLTYSRSPEETYAEVAKMLKQTKLFEDTIAGLNKTIALPVDVQVAFEHCGQVNAFYDPAKHKISMCYELFGRFLEVFGRDEETSDEEKALNVLNTALFTFLHELGHALVDVLEIPITGKEEDAVDDLAVLFLIAGGDTGEAAVGSAMQHFAASAEEFENDFDALAFADEHSFNAQRGYSALCLVYGSDPKKHANLVGDDGLPKERAERCPEEYRMKSNNWGKLLAPFMKEQS